MLREYWKIIPGWPDYEVSNLGRIKRLARIRSGRRWQETILKTKSNEVALSDDHHDRPKREKVSRLVLLAFIGPCPLGMEGCHFDDNKSNNKLTNLRWDTHKANIQDALRNGLMISSTTKLTEDQVISIRREYTGRIKCGRKGPHNRFIIPGSVQWLAQKYNISPSSIYLIIKRKNWKRLT